MRILNMTIALLCFSSYSSAQLSTGDPVPDIHFEEVINYRKKEIRLSDFKGKAVLLDFWSTWCSACVQQFKKMDSLQRRFSEEVQVVLVNKKSSRDSRQKIETVLNKWSSQYGLLGLPLAINDTATETLFPYQYLPHYVWIGKEGRVAAITGSEAVTAENLQALVDGRGFLFDLKKDQDAERPIFSNGDLPLNQLQYYSVLLKGVYPGLPGGERQRRRGNVLYGIARTNTTLYNMYLFTVERMAPEITGRRIIIEGIDSTAVFPPEEPGAVQSWYREHAYSLEVIVPVSQSTRLDQVILRTLNENSPFNGRFEERRMKCLVLVRRDGFEKIAAGGGRLENRLGRRENPYLKNGKMALVAARLNRLAFMELPVVDGTGYDGLVNLRFPEGMRDLEAIRKQLAANGIGLVEREEVIKVFVLRRGE